jgi:DNA-binding NarL/FixJ family response regulator
LDGGSAVMIRLLVVDDHKLFRQGVVNLLKSTKDFEVVGEAESGKDAVMLAVALDPDVIVLDLGLPDISGIDVVKEIQARGLTAKVVMLTMHKDKGYLDMARRLGITSYLLKDDAFEDLLYAIKAVNSGSTYISSSFQKNIISSLPLDIMVDSVDWNAVVVTREPSSGAPTSCCEAHSRP